MLIALARDNWLPMWLFALSELLGLNSPNTLSEAVALSVIPQLLNPLSCLLLYLYKKYTTKNTVNLQTLASTG